MSRKDTLRDRIMTGSTKNISFRDAKTFLTHNNFSLVRVTGSHHIYCHNVHGDISLVLVHDSNGDIKPFLVKKIREQVSKVLYSEKEGE